MWSMKQDFIFDIFNLQMQQVESGKKICGKIWMSIESTLRNLDFDDNLTYGVIWEENAVRVVISKTHYGPVRMLTFITW